MFSFFKIKQNSLWTLSLSDFYIGLDQHKPMIGTKTTVLITDGNTNRVIKYNKSSLLLWDKGLPFTGNQESFIFIRRRIKEAWDVQHEDRGSDVGVTGFIYYMVHGKSFNVSSYWFNVGSTTLTRLFIHMSLRFTVSHVEAVFLELILWNDASCCRPCPRSPQQLSFFRSGWVSACIVSKLSLLSLACQRSQGLL